VLSFKQLEDIKTLQLICEEKDGIQLKLNWDLLEHRAKDENNDFLYYKDDQLVGFLGLYAFGNKVEVCGMVHPNERRHGIFRHLLNKALDECREVNLILLNAPADSSSAKEFLRTVPCEYYTTEYQMQWFETELIRDSKVVIRHAEDRDDEDQIQLDVDCFGFTREEASEFHQRLKNEGIHHFYMIEYGGKTVGKIRVYHERTDAWIYSFAVFPEMQGQGIGRKALSHVVLNEKEKGYRVFLEVEVKNTNALKLYESCGFKTIHAQDYYRYNEKL